MNIALSALELLDSSASGTPPSNTVPNADGASADYLPGYFSIVTSQILNL